MGWQLNTDGGSRGNPGPAGCGIHLVHDGAVVASAGWFLGTATNNHAEYCALVWGLQNALALGARELEVRADSELMIKQVNGVYKVKNPDMKKLFARVQRLMAGFDRVNCEHVYRDSNKEADARANEAMDAGGPVGDYAVPFSEDEDESGTASLFAEEPAAQAAQDATEERIEPAGEATDDSAQHSGKTVLVGVTGCIAAYKACELVRCLQKSAPGINVKVAMTEHAAQFVGPATFRALTGNEVALELFDEAGAPIHHISLAKEADLFVIAPATANVIAKVATGVADDLLTTTALACKAPLVVAPAMNAAMWADDATQENVASLAARGALIVGPDDGYQACGDVGTGRMSAPQAIADAALARLNVARSLEGKKVLVTAGPTHEPVDPVRYIANRSSGLQGYAIAAVAAERGADVTLVSGPVALRAPEGVKLVQVTTALEMLEACRAPFAACDIAVFCAAVADWRPEKAAASKIKHDGKGLDLHLVPNPDIAATLGAGKGKGQRMVVFAAETGDPVGAARAKLTAKNADLVVANDVSGDTGFGTLDNHVWLVSSGSVEELSTCPKRQVAESIFDALA